jgi:hypothetical protein
MSADAADAGTAPGTGSEDGAAELLDGMQEGAEGAEAGTEDQPDETAAQIAHWKEMARKHEKRAKENAAAAGRLKTIEDANKSELQRAQEAQAEAERQRDEAMFTHSRMMAAASNDLPVELIDFLGTGTEEEIGERAELLASTIEETARAIADQLILDMGITPEVLAQLQAGNGNGRNGLSPAPQQLGARPVESLRAGSAPTGGTPNTNEQWFRNLVNPNG